jgi:hypothetical protein
MPRELRHFLVVLTATASCIGSVGGEPRGGGEPAPPPPAGAAGCAPAVPWRTTTLTREQYINAAADLLWLQAEPLVALADVGGRTFTPGVSLSALQVEQRMETAEAIAAAATAPAHLPRLLACDPATVGEGPCADRLIQQLGRRAFRRPLDSEAAAGLRRLFDEGRAAGGFATGVAWMLAGLLQAPDFLYHLSPSAPGQPPGSVAPLDGYTVASRLAFFLWNSPPDDELLDAAERGELGTAAGVGHQARRLLAHPSSARARDDYHAGWLKLADLDEIARSALELTPALIGDLRRSVLAGVAAVYQEGASVERLLSTPALFVNDALAKVYGVPSPGGSELTAVAAAGDQRRGLLTHPALLALLANADSSDPIKRGLFVQERVLCQVTPDPIDDVPDLPPLRPGLSTRARLEQHRSDPVCAACHRLFDPVGMAFENYDAIGRYRTMDQGVAVDSSAEIAQGLDLDGSYPNGMELLARLATSGTARDCMVQQWFEYALSRHPDPRESCALEPLQARFRTSGDLLELLASVAESETFRFQRLAEETGP